MRVAIVGLGIAGLRAAQILQAQGVELALFEARDRCGGRLETVQRNSGWYEAGGEWIDSDHHRVLALLSGFGLEPEAAPGAVPWLHYAGRFLPLSDFPELVAGLGRLQTRAREWAADLDEPVWHENAGWDEQTLASFLDDAASSPMERWLAECEARSDEGDDTDRVGLLGWLASVRNYLGREGGEMSAYRFPGGAQRLCDRMLFGLGLKPCFGHRLESVEVEEGSVLLGFGVVRERFDRAIVTIPPGPLDRVEIGPGWDKRKAALRALGKAPAVKISLEFDRPFWKDTGWDGSIYTELPIQQVWSSGRDGLHLLNCYVCGRDAEAFAACPDTAVERALEMLDAIDQGAKSSFVAGKLHDWVSDPYSLAAFTGYPPGAVGRAMPVARKPFGRLHFAGEWTADWIGFIEGALESAERVAEEVIRAEAA